MCATCGFPLGDKILPFMKKWEKIAKDASIDENKKQSMRKKILDEIGIPERRYCCRMRIISSINTESKLAFRI